MASVFKAAGARKYTILYVDETGRRRKKAGTTDRGTTERIAHQLEDAVELRKAGLVDPKQEAYRDHGAKPLTSHIDAWRDHLVARGATMQHVELSVSRARRFVALVMGASLADIHPDASEWRDTARYNAEIESRVSRGRLSDLTTERFQRSLATLKSEGRSLATCNHHRTAIRSFSRWLWETHRTAEDSLRGLKGFNAAADRRHDRRTISLDELQRLIDAAHNGPTIGRMTGPARALCYRLAYSTGLRYSEITSIAPRSFDWAGPNVTVSAGFTKNGQTATLFLPNDLADDLKLYVELLAEGSIVFPLPRGRGAEMLRVDLDAAGIPYRDASGLVFDFHSLRCELATIADQAGVSPRTTQRLMRHSSLALTGRYTRPRLSDIEAAVESIPSIKPSTNESASKEKIG